jgi:hypothetical protein
MEAKSGFQSSELAALVCGLLVSVIPVLADKVPPDSVWAILLGSLLAVATYIAGRSHVKATTAKANAVLGAAQAAPSSDPSQG